MPRCACGHSDAVHRSADPKRQRSAYCAKCPAPKAQHPMTAKVKA